MISMSTMTSVSPELRALQLRLAPDPEWAPQLYTPPLSETTRGEEVRWLTENFMKPIRGKATDQPLKLRKWQRWLVNSILETKPDGFLRYRQVVVGVPRKQGKTLVAAAIALNALAFWGKGQDIFSIGSTSTQARMVYDEMVTQITQSEYLSEIFYITRDYIQNKITLSKYKPLAANATSAQGLASAMTIADEAHVYGRAAIEMYKAMDQSSGDRDESLMIIITTAGGSKASFLGELYGIGESIVNGESSVTTFGIFWWGLAEGEDVDDPENWRKVNPNLGEGLIDPKEIAGKHALGTGNTLGAERFMADFMRYRLNMWINIASEDLFISDFVYNSCTTPEQIKPGARIALGFDGSKNDDSTGFVAIDVDTGVIQTLAAWHKPDSGAKVSALHKGKQWLVPREEVEEAFQMIMANYEVLRFWFDPHLFETDAERWIKQFPKKNLIEGIPQSPARMNPMSARFREDFYDGKILAYSGDKKLREHVTNAIIYDSGRVAKEKGKPEAKVDLLLAAIMANGARNDLIDSGELDGTGEKTVVELYELIDQLYN